MDLLLMLQELVAKLADAAAALEVAKRASYDEGFAAGVASVGGNPDVKFTQADLDAAVASAVAPLNEQIAALQAQVDGIPAVVADAIAAFKAELAQKYADQQVVESASETGFADLLK